MCQKCNEPELTQRQKALFQNILTPDNSDRLSLVSTMYEGRQVAVICLSENRGEEIELTPIAILVDEPMFEKLLPPE